MADDEQQPDERRRPQYGELAPEGWVWHPPADADRLDTARKPEAAAADQAPAPTGLPRTGDYPPPTDPALRPPQLRRDAPRWNLGWTLTLLIVGFLGMTYSIGVINAFPTAIQLVHSTESLGDYTPDPAVSGILTTASIVMVAMWAASAALSIWLLTHRRLAFYVPLITGALALVVMIVFLSVALATDPALVNFYSGFTPSPSPSLTP